MLNSIFYRLSHKGQSNKRQSNPPKINPVKRDDFSDSFHGSPKVASSSNTPVELDKPSLPPQSPPQERISPVLPVEGLAKFHKTRNKKAKAAKRARRLQGSGIRATLRSEELSQISALTKMGNFVLSLLKL